MIKKIGIVFLCIALTGCFATKTKKCNVIPGELSYRLHDYPRAFNELLLSANKGKPEAEYAIGYMYFYGLGIAKDQDVARVWIERAAAQKYLPALIAMQTIAKTRVPQIV